MIAFVMLGGLSAVILVIWAILTACSEPNEIEWPDRRAHHEEIVRTAGSAAKRVAVN
jgi:hypothetical protein